MKDVAGDDVLVAYDGGWHRDSWLPIGSLRPSLPPYNGAQFNPIPGEVVEVKAKSAENEPYSWWRGSVKTVRPNPAIAVTPDSLGTQANQLIYEISYAGWESEFTEVLEKEMLRPFNKQLCFTVGSIEKLSLPLSNQIAELLTSNLLQQIHYNANTLALYLQPANTPLTLPPTPGAKSSAFGVAPSISTTLTSQPQIHVIGSKTSCQRAVIDLATQLKSLHEQIQMQQQQQQQQQPMPNLTYSNERSDAIRYDSYGGNQQSQPQHHQQPQSHQQHGVGYYPRSSNSYGRSNSPGPYGPQHSSSSTGTGYSHGGGGGGLAASNNYNNPHAPPATPPVQLEFHCPPHLMGMVIGKRHKNLYIAENLDGIYKVHVDTENGSIVVIAKTMDAANNARSLLELTEQTLQIPSVIVGRVVGKNFSIIKEIEQHSGVLRIKVGDDRDHELEFLQQLALNGIPGVNNLDENGNPIPPSNTTHQPTAQTGPAAGEKEKRSAFAVSSHSYRNETTRGGRGGYTRYGSGGYGNDYRGGRYGDVEEKSATVIDEFDIVALEDDKTVEISIIGSPATVSEAELLLRTHIGLITQIYKLSYDEAMLRRQVEALSLVVPMKSGVGAGGGPFGGNNERAYADERDGDRRRGGGGGGGGGHYEKRRVKEDTHMPVWMNDQVGANANSSNNTSTPRTIEDKIAAHTAPVTRRKQHDPSVDVHAARLDSKSARPPKSDAAGVTPAAAASGDDGDSPSGVDVGADVVADVPRKRIVVRRVVADRDRRGGERPATGGRSSKPMRGGGRGGGRRQNNEEKETNAQMIGATTQPAE